SDPTHLLLFEAIGGNGKSMLTWEWTTKHATTVRPDWAGRFWYSFYERGAIMQDFCQRALAYMTGRPLKEFEKRKTAELKDELIAQLHARPWLHILDGLERVLVAYHRIDAAEVPDEEANAPTDTILNRNPCDAIRDEDSDLLRALAACTPSKILVSSRLTPRILLTPAGQTIPGAKRITLPGLRPPDAESLLRQCGITGESAAIQDYLRQNCDNHPLVIGILAGLIANYLPDRGNFDAWSIDPTGGAALDLAKLDLIQRRNHILRAAFAGLSDASRELLSTLALLAESVDTKTLEAFDPHMSKPKDAWVRVKRALKAVLTMGGGRQAQQQLAATVADLESRGLIHSDALGGRHYLHPVVGSVVAHSTSSADLRRCGTRIVDHFTAVPHSPFATATTLDELHAAILVVRTRLVLAQFQQATATVLDLARALVFNLEAFPEILALLRPLFPAGWNEMPVGVEEPQSFTLSHLASIALGRCQGHTQAIEVLDTTISRVLHSEHWDELPYLLPNISGFLCEAKRLSAGIR
ncbi:MAG: hypothetical protein ACOYMN_26155, partial [Roseimicrobium sp.]